MPRKIPAMLGSLRSFVRQCPLGAIGICTLALTAATAALVLDLNPPRPADEKDQAQRPGPRPLEPTAEETGFMGP